ncbi:MAG TPA: HAD family hydrolase [Thiolapillus brandeum]|uniref:HAD family hydrolase n=1 Tax=Thiolapillus brandeum TaxID=1076588 RepID=A0A831RWL8_9GAMM|nr:HAD family hydrolase [Thiolapillus brandeum]
MPAFLLDMDGVLYHGDRVLPGARSFIKRIASVPHLFVTNNSAHTPAMVANKLLAMGFKGICQEQILTSAQATAMWLEKEQPGFRYYAVGGEGLQVALDARLIVTNPDTTVDGWCNGEHLVQPGGGALVAPFEAATGHQALVIGKPEPLLFQIAIARLGVNPGDCVMIGDRPDTDIAGAANAGMKTALVRTGRFLPGDSWPEQLPRPDWDTDSLSELTQLLEQAGLLPFT